MSIKRSAAAASFCLLAGLGTLPSAVAQNPLRNPQNEPAAPTVDPSRIKERMAVISADGQRVGTVERVEGGQIRLSGDDTTTGGLAHLIPLEWVASADGEVKLNAPTQKVRREWKSVQ